MWRPASSAKSASFDFALRSPLSLSFKVTRDRNAGRLVDLTVLCLGRRNRGVCARMLVDGDCAAEGRVHPAIQMDATDVAR
jgi:hypothetical protein